MRQPAQRVEATFGRTGRLAARACSTGAEGSGAPSHRPARLLVSLCLAVAALLALCASPAFAAQTHPYTGVSFGPDGVGGSASFESVGSVAVEPASGDVYVYDAIAGKIYKFDSTGAPVNFSASGTNAISDVGGGYGPEFQVAVAPAGAAGATGGDIYVAHGNNGEAVDVYSPAGTKIGELKQGGASCGVATDPSGAHVYTSKFGGSLSQYTPSANPPTDADKTATGEPGTGLICNIAADGLGNVYEAGYFFSSSGLYRLTGVDDATPTLVDPRARSMAVAGSSNDLYADRENEIAQYDAAGSLIGQFGEGEVFGSQGIAANSAASKIYVGSTNYSTGQVKVKVFGPQTAVPDATAETADAITKTTAVLHGTVGAAGGPETTCVFQYVTESEYFGSGFQGASEKPCSPAGPFTGSSTTAVSATATGLSQQTAYRFRVLATNSSGSNGGTSVGFTTPGAVNVSTDPASDIAESSATLNGTVNPEGVELEECFFRYEQFVYGAPVETVPCAESPATIGSGSVPVQVHADLTGLVVGSTYEFQLVGKSELGTSEGARRRFNTSGPTLTKTESIDGVSETSATFHATINANGVATTYLFEYVTQAEFEASGYAGAQTVPGGGKSIGAGSGAVEVSATAEGLTPHETYRFRVVATNAGGVNRGPGLTFTTRAPSTTFSGCPNDAFRSGFGAALPDCRAYERATPADKGGMDVEGFPGLVAGASDGSGASFSSTGGSAMPAGGGGREDVSTMLSSRFGESWATQRLLPPETLGEKGEYLGSSEDMHFSVVEAGDDTKAGLFLIDTRNESVTEVVPYQTEKRSPGAFHYDAISSDGSRLFFESNAKLTSQAVSHHPNLYMWDRASGQVSSIGILPQSEGGGGAPRGSFGAAYAWTLETTETGGSSVGQYVEAIHAATADGDQIYFTAGETGQLYLRQGLTGGAPTTVAVSKPNAGVEDSYVEEELFGERFPAAFQEATPDGAHAFFISSEKLTADASTGEYDQGKDLYRYDKADNRLVDITANQSDSANPNGARVQGMIGASADGSSGYFAAKGKLTPEATMGENNIYRFEEQSDGSFDLTYVGGVGTAYTSIKTWSPYSYEGGLISDYFGKSSRVSSDGGVLIYMAEGQVRMYRAAGEENFCISCDPGGTASIGDAELTAEFINSNNFIIPGAGPAARLTRNLSADGSRVFFQTPNALLAADTNGSPKCHYLISRPARGLFLPQCTDTYEWEAVGAPGGSCTKVEYNGGCLYLLSTGKSEDGSYFLDASRDGSNVFIATTSQLVPADRDELYDVYDLRTNGGLASQQTVTVAPCSGEACRGTIGTAPASQSAGSASFRGPGNAKPAAKKRCGKKQKCAKKKRGHKHKRNKHKHGHARSSKGDRK